MLAFAEWSTTTGGGGCVKPEPRMSSSHGDAVVHSHDVRILQARLLCACVFRAEGPPWTLPALVNATNAMGIDEI
jgi:hypothetical protein